MQPTYLSCPGYFNLVWQADVFVFLDNVPFSAQSWQQRNRVVLGGKPHWLTVPVVRSGLAGQLIRDVQTFEPAHWRRKHLGTLQQAYARHPYGKSVVGAVERILEQGEQRLSKLNMAFIRHLCNEMRIEAEFHLGSDLPVRGRRSEYLLEICRHFGADTYLSAAGSREYIEEEGILAASEVRVIYQAFHASPYPQAGVESFIPRLSTVDLLANVGFEEGRRYVCRSCG